MNIEPTVTTRKGPQRWSTGDVCFDPIAVRNAAPARKQYLAG